MNKLIGRLACVSVLFAATTFVLADQPAANSAPVQVAVDQLKDEAFKALRTGDFDRTNTLLKTAAERSSDPELGMMSKWTSQFETQRQGFVAERHKEFDKAVADVKKLASHNFPVYAIDQAARAHLLADDKKAFHDEPWVDSMIKSSATLAEDFEKKEQWIRALRIYSDLSSLEPSNPLWKDNLKLATRRIRLLALYTPDRLKAIQDSETKEREAADALLKGPTTKPASNPIDEKSDEFKLDWHETLKDVDMPMLMTALEDARTNYWRDITYKDLILGGLNGIKAVITTRGLEDAFPGLGDEAKRNAMLAVIDESSEAMKGAGASNEHLLAKAVLSKLRSANHDTIDLPEEVLVSEFADGAFAELDPFTSAIWPSDLAEFTKQTAGEFSGVGIQIQSDPDGSLKVVSPLEDSPAYKAGIKPDDVITHINGKRAKGITLTQAVNTITGPPGTTVNLTIRSTDGTSKDYAIKRETIKVASIKGYHHHPGGGWDYLIDPDNKIAYVRLTNFTKTTGDELDKAAEELKAAGAKGVILDLRYNPGGLLTAATEVSDKFLKDGVIVSTHADRETPNSPTVATAKDDHDELEQPMVVLVNQYSASASEIVSGCLKDHHRALVVGERTFGKGSVQMLFPLENRKAYLKLTTSHYYLPSGRCLHREENSTEWGVDPDVKVEMTPEQMRTAIDARQELDIIRDANSPPAQGAQEKVIDKAKEVEGAVASVKKDKKDLLASDPQLSAAVLMLRLELAGAQL
jgi:carboxyl-terminal processing protease